MNEIALPDALLPLAPLMLVLPGALLIRWLRLRPAAPVAPLLTPAQVAFFHVLRRAVPHDHVFAQVCPSAVLGSTAGLRAWLAGWWQGAEDGLGWVVCDESLHTVCVVELDTDPGDARRQAARDARLRAAGVAVVRWSEGPGRGTMALRLAIEEARQWQRSQRAVQRTEAPA